MKNEIDISIHHKSKQLISIVIPVFNEEANVARAYEAVTLIFESDLKDKYEYEIIFTDNNSNDNTYQELQKLGMRDQRVRIVRFTRNYGFNKSLLTGYRLANGDAAIQLDCDLQDSPKLFSVLLELWEKGHDVVVGQRSKRKENFLLQNARKFYYRFLDKISEDNLVLDGGDFRLVDKSILNKLKRVNEATPYVRGLISTLARNQICFPYERQIRLHGNSKFPVRKLMGLAVDGIICHSIIPLRLASLTGLIIATLTFVLALIYLMGKLFFNVSWPAGFATEVVLILFSIALNSIFLGIIGEYLGRIYRQLRNHPLTVVADSINVIDSVDWDK